MRHAPGEDDEPSYELVAVNQLPVVDVNKSVKRALLSEDGVETYKRISKKIKLTSIFFYFIAFPIGAAVLTVETKYARFLSLFKFSFQVPLLIAVTAGLRIDIIRCLAVTYEFWFFTVINALACVVFAINFSDMRIFMAPVYWYGIQLCVCADAKIQDPRVGSASALAAIYHIFLLVVFGMKLTPDAHIIQLFSNNGHGMTSTDFLMNSFPTIMLLLARTAYRKRGFQKKHGLDPLAIRLASFRCRVKLSEKKSGQTITAKATLKVDRRRRSDPGSSLYLTADAPDEAQSVLQRLHLIKPTQKFKACDIVAPNVLRFIQSHPRVPCFVGVLGCFGFILNVVAFVCSYYWNKSKVRSGSFWTLSVLGFLCSLSFCGAFVGLYQRQLLRKLSTSFDFIFITLQNTLAYLSICDMMYWDPRCLTILTGWLWLVWLLTLDCLTPMMRSVTGFHTKLAIPVLLFAIFVQGLLTEQILFAYSVDLQDRVFWRPKLMGFSMEIRAVPFFLGRVVTLVLWSLRVLWRLCTSGEDDLIMIQGTVEFFGNPKALQKKNSTASLSLPSRAQRGPSLSMLRGGPSLSALQRGSSRIVPSELDPDAVKPMRADQE
ncbi:hypothetical protein Gpo141_00007101 [Globisporangium polare]